MSEYTEIPVKFSKLTARNMKKGRPFQLSASALTGNTHKMMVHPALAKKIHRSIGRKKGMRMSLSPEEISKTMEKNGGAIKFLKTESASTSLPKKGTGGKNIIKAVTDGYKKFRDDPKNAKIRKAIQQGAKTAISGALTAGATALGTAVGAPEAGAVVGTTVAPALADMAVDKIGLGVKKPPYQNTHGVLSRNFHTFLSPQHPAFRSGDGRYRAVTGQGIFVSAQDAAKYS